MAIGVCSVAIAAVVAVLALNHRFLVFSVEDVGESHAVWVYSRFLPFLDVKTGSGPVSLLTFFFPGSQSTEQTNIEWYGEPPRPRAQLTVWRLTSSESLPKVTDWYLHRLGREFVQSTGWPKEGQEDQDGWISAVLRIADPDAVVFRQILRRRVRGVLVQAPLADGRARITLYDRQR